MDRCVQHRLIGSLLNVASGTFDSSTLANQSFLHAHAEASDKATEGAVSSGLLVDFANSALLTGEFVLGEK